MAKISTVPSTISDVLGIPAALVLLLLATLVLALVVLREPEPSLVIRDEAPAVRTYCVGGQLIVVSEAGKHGGGAC